MFHIPRVNEAKHTFSYCQFRVSLNYTAYFSCYENHWEFKSLNIPNETA